MALGCQPLVSDTVATTGDSSSGGAPSASASASTNATASTSTTANVSTSEDPSTTTDVTSTDGSDTSPPLDPTTHWCQPICETVADCCITLLDDPTCLGMLGEFPLALECVAGVCTSRGCANDEECELNEVQDLRCVLDDTLVPYCSPVCVTDGDCTAAGFAGLFCKDGVCHDPPCVTDDDCPSDEVCLRYTGTCTPACQSAGCGSYGECQPDGHCGCTSDDECWDGLGCVPT